MWVVWTFDFYILNFLVVKQQAYTLGLYILDFSIVKYVKNLDLLVYL